MTHRNVLYRAICAAPDDDTPRLAFADFLEEEGGKENVFRAGYIRGAIRLAREESRSPAWQAARTALDKFDAKVYQRLIEHKLAWVKHLEGRARSFELERGFVGHLTVFSKRFVAEAGRFFDEDPIRSVKFVKLTAASGTVPLKDLLACTHLTRVAKLALDESELTDSQLGQLTACPHLAGLRSISLAGSQQFGPKTLVKLLQGLSAVTELLMPWSMRFDDRFAAALAGSPAMAKLTSLNLRDHLLNPAGVIAILTSKHAANLRELQISVGYEHDEYDVPSRRRFRKADGKEVAAVLGKCRFPNLRSLDFDGYQIGDVGLAAIAGGGFPALRQLSLDENALTATGLKVLAESPVGKQLVYLSVGFNPKLEDSKVLKQVRAMFPNATLQGYGTP